MATSVLEDLAALADDRRAIDERERSLVRRARAVLSGEELREARNGRHLRNPVRCRDQSCECNSGGWSVEHVHTWAEIADQLGVSRAAAHKRYPDIR